MLPFTGSQESPACYSDVIHNKINIIHAAKMNSVSILWTCTTVTEPQQNRIPGSKAAVRHVDICMHCIFLLLCDIAFEYLSVVSFSYGAGYEHKSLYFP